MNSTAAAVVGREAELDVIDAFLADRSALPAALVMDGPAGAGKSTLWHAAVDRATEAGFTVLACRPAGAEAQLSYAALADLLEGQLEAVLPNLPAPQRRALEVALLLEDDAAATPDQRAISAGTLSAIRALAMERPMLIAIDDAQWLDPPSADAVTFALRRLRDSPVAAISAWRVTSPSVPAASPPPGRAALDRAFERSPARIDIGPLSLGAMNRLLRTRTSLEFNRRTLQRIHETSGGNPFYALELARALEAAPDSAATEPLALTSSLTDLLAERLHGLSEATREALFVAAALSQSQLARIAAALGGTEAAATDRLAPAARAGILRLVDGAVEFAHPLFAAAAYAAIPAEGRRRWHALIADTAVDSETRARHAALATPGPDTNAAALLHAAAADALARGAPGVAAELYLAALERRPATADRVERAMWILEAGPVIQSTGALDVARSLVESALVDLPSGPDRSEGLRLLAELVGTGPGGSQQELELVEDAIVEAGSDARRRAAALLDREMIERSTARLDLALPIARQALEAAEESGDVFLQAHGHVRTADLETLLGLAGDDPIPRFARAEELDRRVHVDAESSAPVMLAVCLIRMGRLDEARPRLLDGKRRAAAEGDERSLQQICLCLAELEWLAGNWNEAAGYAAEGLEIAEQANLLARQGSTTGLVALLEASRGDPERARAIAERGIAMCHEVGDIGYERYGRQVLAFLELSLGEPAATLQSLDSYVVGHAIEGPKRIAFVGDLIEAFVATGDVDRAAGLTDELAKRGAEIRRPPMLATADRCRALVLAARGESEGALASAQAAVDSFKRLALPFELGRALLVLGEVQRRAKQRKAARETLDEAIARFEALGARLWVERARAEQARIGGRTTIEGLSETELRVAQLVAEGRSNKDVAAALFVSVRAVEANLSRVYAKLGIESRTELARRFWFVPAPFQVAPRPISCGPPHFRSRSRGSMIWMRSVRTGRPIAGSRRRSLDCSNLREDPHMSHRLSTRRRGVGALATALAANLALATVVAGSQAGPSYLAVSGWSAGAVGPNVVRLTATTNGAIPKRADQFINDNVIVGIAWADLGTGTAVVATIHPTLGRDSNQRPDSWHLHTVQLAGGATAPNDLCLVSVNSTPTAGIAIQGSSVSINLAASKLPDAGSGPISVGDLDAAVGFTVHGGDAGCATGLGVRVRT